MRIEHYRRRLRLLIIALMAVPVLQLTACEDGVTSPDPVEGVLIGTWSMEAYPGYAYVNVTASAITIFESHETRPCYDIAPYDVIGSDGSTYELRRRGANETVHMTVQVLTDDRIEVTYAGNTNVFVRDAHEVSTLEGCSNE